MAVYIFMSLSIILGIALLLDFFGVFSRSKDKFDVEIEDYAAKRHVRRMPVQYSQTSFQDDKKRKAA